MSGFSNWSAIATALALCAIAFFALRCWHSRRRLRDCLRELEAQKKSSSLLETERRVEDRMNRGSSLAEVLDIVTRSIEELMPECRCTVMLLDEKRQQLREGSKGSLPEAYMRAIDGLIIGPEVGACGSAAFRNETVVVEDIATDSRFAPVRDFVMSFGLRACWSVPIRGANRNVLGTFAMYHGHPARPQNRELGIVEAGAHLAGNVIERLRATERLKQNEERIALAEKAAFLGVWELDIARGALTLSRELAAQVGLADAAHQLTVRQLRTMIHTDDWQIVLAGLERASSDGKLFHAEFRIVLSSGSIRWLRAQASVEFAANRPRRMIGVSVDITREKEMMEELLFQANHDGLTGIWNRKAILDLMRREFEQAARAGTTTGLIVFDLDHFKNVNDTYGHPAGDCVLRESIRRLQLVIRSYDLVGRYGGEEFLVVLPNCDKDEVEKCAERIRAAIQEEQELGDGVRIQVTASFGMTVADPSVITEQKALATADAAMYRAKSSGRNRAEYLGPDESGSGAYDDETRQELSRRSH